ncbi:MAG: 30S ribosome-binding factor RbfA [Wenzhouxiangella sp.]|nr:30S ribosome-binding factor RbfA [Wenzhouxiangella sp.]MDR9453654.1 30S ribosome-binding factor RbfA [Wenzhouxiangella sp.]
MGERCAEVVQRAEKVSGLLRRELASIIQQSFQHEIPPGLFSVTDVEVARDLSHAKVFVAILDADEASALMAFLNEHVGQIRHELGKRTRLRITPSLKFFQDTSSEAGARIDALLAKSRRS